LALVVGGRAHGSGDAAAQAPEFPLLLGTTVLGGAPSQDICLPGLAPAYGAIVHRPDDEYLYHRLDGAFPAQLNGRPVDVAPLHHGDRLTVGAWDLVFQRDEFADHGRFDGGRQGGEFSGDPVDHR
jgi:hypothetical protein